MYNFTRILPLQSGIVCFYTGVNRIELARRSTEWETRTLVGQFLKDVDKLIIPTIYVKILQVICTLTYVALYV